MYPDSLFSSCFVYWPLTCHIHLFTHTHLYTDGTRCHARCQPRHQRLLSKAPKHIAMPFTQPLNHPWNSHRELFGVQYVAQGYFDVQSAPPTFPLVDVTPDLMSHSHLSQSALAAHNENIYPYSITLCMSTFLPIGLIPSE